MKYLAYVLLLAGCTIPWEVWGYQQQGFAQYMETNQGISFQCTNQCFLLLGSKNNNDVVTIKGISGEGQVIVGILAQNGQIIPIGQQDVGGETDYSFTLIYQQPISNEAQIGVIFMGNINGAGAAIMLQQSSLSQKINYGWKDFWVNEGLMPYTINLRYGIKIIGTSIVKIGYSIFILILCIILFTALYKNHKAKALFYYGICLVLLLGVRNLYNWIDRTTTGMKQYTFAPSDQKVFFDLGDYIVFVDKMRDVLSLDDQFGGKNCTIMSQGQSRPFVAHLDSVYIKPCNPVTEKSKADYLVYYHQTIPQEDISKPKLLEFNGSFVLKNN